LILTDQNHAAQAPSFFNRIGDAKANGGFASVPNKVLRDNALTVPARLLYGIMCSHWGGDKSRYAISRDELAREMGLSVRQVSDYIFELEKAELIVRKRPPQKGMTNTYWAMPIASRYEENVDRNSAACDQPPITTKNISITTLEEPNSFGESSAVEESSPSTPFPNGQSKEEHAPDRRSPSYQDVGEGLAETGHPDPNALTRENAADRLVAQAKTHELGWPERDTRIAVALVLDGLEERFALNLIGRKLTTPGLRQRAKDEGPITLIPPAERELRAKFQELVSAREVA
jgi:DNA-binding MarR family transcriptional regulator